MKKSGKIMIYMVLKFQSSKKLSLTLLMLIQYSKHFSLLMDLTIRVIAHFLQKSSNQVALDFIFQVKMLIKIRKKKTYLLQIFKERKLNS